MAYIGARCIHELDMTKEDLEKLRSMTKYEVMKRYWPEVQAGTITASTYSWLIEQGK